MKIISNEVSPSILAGNHLKIIDSLKVIELSGAKWIHLDIMDGHFVPNLSFGYDIISALRKESYLYFDIHLMVTNPEKHIKNIIKLGANNITIHTETKFNIIKNLQLIKSLNCDCGIALNPNTPVSFIKPFLFKVDLVLVMTVEPGLSGQVFIKNTLNKVLILNNLKKKYNYSYRIQVDGGINIKTGLKCKKLGANTFVSGKAFFNYKNKKTFIKKLIF